MPLAKTNAISLMGLAGSLVEVEVDISNSLPGFVLVGLPDASLSEAASRVRAACVNSGYELPARKITVNLSPASVPKFGSGFDLAIAIGVLAAAGKIPNELVSGCVFVGELGLDGSLRRVNGILPIVMQAKRLGFKKVALPRSCLAEASLVQGVELISANGLSALIAALGGATDVSPIPADAVEKATESEVDLHDVVGQPEACFAMLIAAAGGHNLAMIGVPGAGKTMLAERLPTILPNLNLDQALEVTALHSLVGQKNAASGINLRPRFQAPHHSASTAAIIGGGLGVPRPGAISLAHHGVLFLDEITEFQNNVLQSLREPLEARKITIARSAGQAVFPASFQMVLAANPCPCGNFGSTKTSCQCTSQSRQRYLTRLSGPLFDRVDIRLQIQPVGSLFTTTDIETTRMTSSEARAKVELARDAALERLKTTRFLTNAEVSSSYLRNKLKLSKSNTAGLTRALDRGLISMRGYDRCLRLAWTIADFEGAVSPTADHLAIAMGLRGTETGGYAKN